MLRELQGSYMWWEYRVGGGVLGAGAHSYQIHNYNMSLWASDLKEVGAREGLERREPGDHIQILTGYVLQVWRRGWSEGGNSDLGGSTCDDARECC